MDTINPYPLLGDTGEPSEPLLIYSEEDYLLTEESASKGVYVRLSYIDMCDGDFNSALLMSRIRFWHMPSNEDKTKGKTKLRVIKDGVLWIAKKREDWWEEIRLTPKQVDRSLKVLVDLGFIEKKVFKFNGDPVLHVRALLKVIRLTEISLLLQKDIPLLPSEGITKLPSTVISLTESTTKTTTGTKEKGSDKSSPEIKKASKEKPDGSKIKKPTKIINKKSKSVSDIQTDVENNMSVDTIQTLVEYYKTQPMVSGNLSEFWVRCIRAQYPEAGFAEGAKLNSTDTNKLRMATQAYKADKYNTLGMVLENWLSFTEHAKMKQGAFGLPELPTINFLLKWKDAVLSFKVVNSGVEVAVSKPQAKEKIPSMPKGKKLL